MRYMFFTLGMHICKKAIRQRFSLYLLLNINKNYTTASLQKSVNKSMKLEKPIPLQILPTVQLA